MRARGEDKGEAQNLAAVVAHLDLLAVGELDLEIGRLPGNLRGPQGAGREDDGCKCECAHGENPSIQDDENARRAASLSPSEGQSLRSS